MLIMKSWLCLGSHHRPLVSEATALPTEPLLLVLLVFCSFVLVKMEKKKYIFLFMSLFWRKSVVESFPIIKQNPNSEET